MVSNRFQSATINTHTITKQVQLERQTHEVTSYSDVGLGSGSRFVRTMASLRGLARQVSTLRATGSSLMVPSTQNSSPLRRPCTVAYSQPAEVLATSLEHN